MSRKTARNMTTSSVRLRRGVLQFTGEVTARKARAKANRAARLKRAYSFTSEGQQPQFFNRHQERVFWSPSTTRRVGGVR